MAIKAVLFDLDGTLVDTAPDFIYVVNTMRSEEGLSPIDHQLIRATVSKGAKALVTLAFNSQEGDCEFSRLHQRLLELYSLHIAVHSKLFTGISSLLKQLQQHGIAWGIATNKPEIYTTPLLNALNIQPKAQCIICPDHVRDPKPHPESMYLAGQLINCTPEEIIYIGDHIRDIECGRRAGSITIAAGYGYIDTNENLQHWQADHTVHTTQEIWPIISSYINSAPQIGI